MHTKRPSTCFLRGLAALTLLLTGLLSTVASTSAQSTVDVAIWTTENGQPAYDACYVLVGYSEVGCDENGDGRVMFAAIPYGTYTVRQTADLGPGRSVPDFTINVHGNRTSAGWESFAAVIVNTGGTSGSSRTSGASDIAIVTTENGRSVTDACYVIVDYSDIGCDENGDGKITFEDIPYGTWTVHQTNDLGAGRYVNDFTITVTGAASSDGWERFPATVRRSTSSTSGPSSSGDAKDISLITRDPNSGDLLTGTCYVLMDYSEEGCDENGDGQVTFDDMPTGTYTVHQTRTPSGYTKVKDFPITIDGSFPNVAVGYLVKQAAQQNARGTRNVSFVFVDSRAKTKVVPAQVCLQIGDVSNVGCDEDLVDGQIDFLEVKTGNHRLSIRNLPSGWSIVDGGSATISGGDGPQVIYLLIKTGDGSGAKSSGGNNSGSSGGTTGTNGANSRSNGTSSDSGWFAPVVAWFCETPTASLLDCHGEAGVTINIYLASGELVGTCTTGAPGPTPWGTAVSYCMVKGLPLNESFVARQDPGTLPDGYAPVEESLELQVGSSDPVGFEGVAFAFRNVPTDASTSASAQDSMTLTIAASNCQGPGVSGGCKNAIGARFTVTTESGNYLGECTIEGHGNEPYLVACGVEIPKGMTVVVTEDTSTIPEGLTPEVNPIVWDTTNKPKPPNVPSFWGPIFKNGPSGGNTGTSSSAAGSSNIAIITTENGNAVTDVCYVLVSYSEVGCDENGDGKITIEDIPYGTYTVRQTADLGSGRTVSDFTITVTGAISNYGWELFRAEVT